MPGGWPLCRARLQAYVGALRESQCAFQRAPENVPEAAQLPGDLLLRSPCRDPLVLIHQQKRSGELEKSNNWSAASCE